jgi:hypothetical protein
LKEANNKQKDTQLKNQKSTNPDPTAITAEEKDSVQKGKTIKRNPLKNNSTITTKK